jgi:hypothetical protein
VTSFHWLPRSRNRLLHPEEVLVTKERLAQLSSWVTSFFLPCDSPEVGERGFSPMASPRFGRRFGSPPCEQQPRTSHLRADAGPCIIEWQYFDFASATFLNSNTSLSMYLFCNSRIHVISLYSGHTCVYYASMLRCWHLVWILVRTDHPYLGVGCHRRRGGCGAPVIQRWCSGSG